MAAPPARRACERRRGVVARSELAVALAVLCFAACAAVAASARPARELTQLWQLGGGGQHASSFGGAERERRPGALLGAFAHAFDGFGDERHRRLSDSSSDVPGEAPPGVQVGGEEADEARRAAAQAAALAATIPPPPPPPPPPPAPPTPPPGPPAREKTLAGTIDRILEKEFKEEAQAAGGGALGEKFNATLADQGQAVLETVARVTRTGVRIDSRSKDAAAAAVAIAAAAADPDPDSLPGLHGAASSEPEERAAELGADSGGIGGVGGLAADNGFGADVDPSDARAAALAVDILPMRGAALGIGAAAAAGGLADETSVGGAFHPRHGGGDGGVNASAYARDFHQEDAAKKAKHAAALGDGAGGGIGGSGMMTGGGAGVKAGYDDGGDDYAARRSVAPPPAPRDIMASLVAGAAQAASLALGDLAGGISGGEGGAEGEPEDVPRLIDAHDNVYVMSNPAAGDRMQLQQDAQLIADIVTVLVAAAVGGAAAAAMGQPSITGFLVAGACVGPGGAGLVAELVQVETFAQFGVILLLFCLGLEFSGTKLRAVRAVALAGGLAAMALLMFGAGVAAKLIGAPPGEGVFVGALVSMSSTAVVVKCLQERNALGTLHGQVTIGTLILQDCTIGLLFAMLPSLGDPERGAGAALAAATRVVAAAAAFAACAALAARHAVPRLLRWAAARGPELQQLTSLALCLALSKASDAAGLSLELGAFVAGVTIAAAEHGERTLHGIEPVRNVFAALFLASIGLLLNPWFLWTHRLALLSCLAVVVVCKAALTALVVRAFGYSARTALVVGMSLAQVGEFSFVLLARASTLKLVQRPAYLLLLGTTALSLLVTPLLFRAQPPLLRFAVAAGWLRAAPEDETAEAEAKADAKAADIEADGGGPGGSPRLAGAAQGDEPGGAGDASGAALGSSAGAGLTSAVSRARASASLHHVAAQHRAQYGGALMSPKGR